jgi:hypothetical protein
MEDIRLGRETGRQWRAVAVPGTTPTQICPPDPRRTAVIISASGGDDVTVAPEGDPPSGVAGIYLASYGAPLVLDLVHHGALVTAAWYAYCAAGGTTVSVATATLQRE